MANTVLSKRSAVAGKVPATSDLALGELGINTYDGKLYLKKDNGTASIVDITLNPYDIAVFIEGLMVNSEVVHRMRPRACSFPAGGAGSYADAGTAATGAFVLSAKKNGSAFVTWTWSAAGTVATVALASTTTFNGSSDILTFEGGATADTTLANLGVYLAGNRS